jgi:hypothetical protein
MNDLGGLGKLLVVTGLAVAGLGALLWLGGHVPGLRLGRLPGDIRIERESFRFYFPITTMVLISLGISAVLWLLRRLGK